MPIKVEFFNKIFDISLKFVSHDVLNVLEIILKKFSYLDWYKILHEKVFIEINLTFLDFIILM